MLTRLNDFTSLLLKLLLIVVIVIAGFYLVVSVYGNWSLAQPLSTGIPGLLSIGKAPFEISIKNTGETLLAKSVEDNGSGRYTLNGYYSIIADKWVWHENTLVLDTYYFGPVSVEKRSK